MSEDPVGDFDKLLADSKFVFGIVYRGHWCPFCISHIKSLKPIEKAIHDAGGQTVIITAEVAEHLPKVKKATGYTGPAIVDPKNMLVKELKKRDVANVAISEMKIRKYEHGMAQPAVFVIQQDGTVLYSWAIVPKLMNLGGAKDRPSLKEIWENVDAKLNGREAVHPNYSSSSVIKVISEKFGSG